MTNTIYIHQPEKAVSFTRLPNFLFEAPTFTPLSNEAIDILANNGIMAEDAVRMYIDTRIGNKAGKGNEGLYHGLMEILKNRRGESSVQKSVDGTQRQIVLL